MSPPNSYAGVLTFHISQSDVVWKQSLYRSNYVKMRSLGWALIQCDRCLYKMGKFVHKLVDTGRLLCGDEGWDWGDVSTGQGVSEIVSTPSEWDREEQIHPHGSQKEPALPTPSSWTYSLQNCKTINLEIYEYPVNKHDKYLCILTHLPPVFFF